MPRYIFIILLIPFFLLCERVNDSKEDSKSILENISLLFIKSNRVTISGTAVKGILKNALVKVNPLNADGTCNSSIILGTETTDSTGNYSLTYNKTGTIVCLIVSAHSNGLTSLYDEKSNTDISVPSTSSFNLVSILPESKIISNSRKNSMISPFSKMLAKRLQYLIRQSGTTVDLNSLHKKAGKELVIRFGLNSGLSVVSGKANLNQTEISLNITDNDYPELDDILLELENPNSPLTAKFVSVLVGFSYLANKYKTGTQVSIEDIDAIIEAFSADFEDGLFDGKAIDGKAITIGTGASQVTFSNTPLTGLLLPAIISYMQEGGKLTVGNFNIATVSVTASQISNQVSFIDNTIIGSQTTTVALAPTISFPTSFVTFTENALASSPATVTGTITTCTSSPSLPTGLTLVNTTCAFSGTPTARKPYSSYTITASGPGGTANAIITLSVIPSSFLRIFVSASSVGPGVFAASADTACMSDVNKPAGGSTYKALGALATRRACSTANCSGGPLENLDWILYPNTAYRRGDGTTVIGTTTSSSIFTFNLTNSFGTGGFPTTFFNTDWTQSVENCANGTNTVGNVRFAQGVNATTGAISFNSTGCNAGARELICVEL